MYRFIHPGSWRVEKANTPRVWFQYLIAALGGRLSFMFLYMSMMIVVKISDRPKGFDEDPLILLALATTKTGRRF